jgi:glycosyltransferase involved in cell wall biosynthesis
VRVVETPDWLPGRGRTGWDAWDTLRRILYVRGERWDLVHAFDSRPAVILPALAAGAPLVLDWADWWGRGGTITERTTGPLVRHLVGPLETWFEEHFRTRAQASTVISRALEERAVGLGVKRETVCRIPNGCDVESVRPLERGACRDALGLPRDAPILGHLGAMNASDAEVLFGAWERLTRKRGGCTLLLVGRHYVRVPAIEGIVELGYVPRETLLQSLGACDVLLAPLQDTIASRGRWPSKLNDYLAAGRPVAACAVGDVRELFERHAAGVTSEPTPDAFARAIEELLEDSDARETMGRNARAVAENELSWDRLAGHLENHYRIVA